MECESLYTLCEKELNYHFRYFLFFSSNCYNTNLYDISYATASSIAGPYTKASTPFKVTGNNGLTAPGGLSVMPSNNNFAVCAFLAVQFSILISAQGFS
jgi:hypothetical protein